MSQEQQLPRGRPAASILLDVFPAAPAAPSSHLPLPHRSHSTSKPRCTPSPESTHLTSRLSTLATCFLLAASSTALNKLSVTRLKLVARVKTQSAERWRLLVMNRAWASVRGRRRRSETREVL